MKMILTMGLKTLIMTMGLKVLREERADDQCETTADINALRNKVALMGMMIIDDGDGGRDCGDDDNYDILHEMNMACLRGKQLWLA